MFALCRGPSVQGARFGVVAGPTSWAPVRSGDDEPISACSDCEGEEEDAKCSAAKLNDCEPDSTRSTAADLSELYWSQEDSGLYPESVEKAITRLSPIGDEYTLGKVVGVGAYGKVHAAVYKPTGARVAVKTVSLAPGASDGDTKAEIELQSSLRHPNILGLHCHFCEPDGRTFHLVMDLCAGGDLTDAITAHVQRCKAVFPAYKGGLSGNVCEKYMWQMTSAVAFLHRNRIVHRDIKPNNFMLESPNSDSSFLEMSLQLSDFGFATRTLGYEKLTRPCGTLYYRAPEVVKCSYDNRADVWSLGVTAFAMCTDTLPFGEALDTDAGDAFYVKQAAAGVVTCGCEWEEHKGRMKDLVLSLLVVDPERRPSCRQLIREHEWLRKHAPANHGGGWAARLRSSLRQ